MGLDISAYNRLTAAPFNDCDDAFYNDGVYIDADIIEYTERCFPGRTQGIVAGGYTYDDKICFNAGSYSGYGRWRKELANKLGYEIEVAWREKTVLPTMDFFELINFSDSEGVIGSVVAAKLAVDFERNEHKMCSDANDYWAAYYRKWFAAFVMAADDGIVVFH